MRRIHGSLQSEPEEETKKRREEELKNIREVIDQEMKDILETEPQFAADIVQVVAKLRKMAIPTEDEEQVLQTKIISPKEVARRWSEWLESVDSEVQALTDEKKALKQLSEEEHESLRKKAIEEGRKIEYLPSKMVYTLKPGEKGGKKKTRWVVCGNFEEKKEGEENYSGGADATAFRVLIWASGKFQWRGWVIDVRTAFLNADMEVKDEENLLLVKPPFILVEKKYLAPSTVFLPLKAVYGFRRSPRLWGTHRDHKMRQLEVKVKRRGEVIHVMLSQLGSEPNLWKVVQVVGEEEDENATLTNGRILGLVMTYVDDIFVSGQDDVVWPR